MSYLAGPLSRDQVSRLCTAQPAAAPAEAGKPQPVDAPEPHAGGRPMLEPGVRETFIGASRARREGETVTYTAALCAEATVTYTNARSKIDETESFTLLLETDDAEAPDWSLAEDLPADSLQRFDKPAAGAGFATCPGAVCAARNHKQWQKKLSSWIRTDRPLVLLRSGELKTTSAAGETERDFRIRLQQLANEQRDIKAAKLRETYANKLARLEDRLMSAEQALDRESEQASGSKLDTALSVGTAILGAFLGRKRVSATSVSRAGTAARRAGNMRKQMGDVKRAEAKVAKIEADIEALKERCEDEVAALDEAYDAQRDELTEVRVRARSTNIRIDWFGIAWQPVFSDSTNA